MPFGSVSQGVDSASVLNVPPSQWTRAENHRTDIWESPQPAVTHPENPSAWQTVGHEVSSTVESWQSLHTGTHSPATQLPLSATTLQTCPHSPQFSTSFNGLTHTLSQSTSGAIQGSLVSVDVTSPFVSVDASVLELVSELLVVELSVEVSSSATASTQDSSMHTNPARHCP